MHGSHNRPAALEQIPCGQKKRRYCKEELSEVKAREVACLELGADAQLLLLCVRAELGN